MKRRMALFLALIMLLGILPVNVFAASDAAKPAPKNVKNYEEVTIDGRPYKVYKLADLMDKPAPKSPLTLKSMAKFVKPLADPGTTAANDYKFVLELSWETIDRPVDNVELPVYVGPPGKQGSIKLGHFVVSSVARPGVKQSFDMKPEYSGTNPSIDFLVKNAFTQITVAIPEDMRYDFILAGARWDNKRKESNKIIFVVYGSQSVMHGYGIRWYDNDPANRDKIAARWEGKENQISDVKLGTENRDYSVYINNVLDTNDSTNVKTYPDGMKYSNYDYYYNGKKITTYADADNKGKYDSELLTIQSKRQAPFASLKVEDGNDYKLKGEKVLKNDTKYFYNSVGDYRTFHVLSMREALNVKFNTGKGSLTDGGDPIQDIGKPQEIGHSEKIKGNESGREITFPDGSKLIPPAKPEGQTTDNEFKGWNTDKNATAPLTQGELDALTFTEKTTTFYAIYGPKDDYHIKVEYVDENGKKIDAKYKLDGQEYPETKSGKTGKAGEAISADDLDITKAPKFLGYEVKAVKTEPKPAIGETATYTTDGKYTVKFVYKKLESVIPEKEPNGGNDNTKPEGYVTVTFKAGDHGKINGDTKDVKFFVNPKDDVKFGDSKIKVPTIEAVGDYVVKNPNWNPDLNDAKKDETITADATFTAQYDEKGKHTVTFDADNGTANTTQQVVDGKMATKPATDPTKKGYTFKEWQKDGQTYDFNTAVTENITLKAAYTENDVKFEYATEDANKGTVDKTDETVKAATGTAAGSTATAMDGYRFTHWTKDGDNTFKADTAKVTPEKTDGVYVAAKYTAHFAKEVSVKYDLNAPSGFTAKGNAPTDSTKYIAGEKATVLGLPAGAGVEGCEFLGWSTDKDATTATYKAGGQIDIAGENDVTLYAVWKKGTKEVTFTFEFYKKAVDPKNLQPSNALGDFKKPKLENITGQEVGADIKLPTYEEQKVTTGDLQGTWKFDGWYRNGNKVTDPKVSANDAENKLVGKWILEETKTAKVTREFAIDPAIVGDGKDVPAGHALPSDVTKQKPNDTTNYIGSEQTPGKDKFKAVPEKIGEKEGTWTFKAWDKTKLTVDADEAMNKFIGTWTWTEKGKINIKYVFKAVGTDKALPKEILDQKPADTSGYQAPADPTLPAVASHDVIVNGDKVGTWTRGNKWSKEVDDNGNITYTLTWTFEETRSDKPTIDPVKPGDKTIEGKGKPGSKIKVTIPGVKDPIETEVGKDGKWKVDVPENKKLKEGEVIKATQKTEGLPESKETEITVRGDEPVVPVEPKKRDDYINLEPVGEQEAKRATDIHVLYLYGYQDKTVHPQGDMTRAEAAAMVARLKNLDMSDTSKPDFKDVESRWYNSAINAVVKAGLMKGYPDGTFAPNGKITRAEFAQLIKGIDNPNMAELPFTDVAGHWGLDAISQAYANKRIAGYPDNTFKPNNDITRAEAVTILNSLFDRGIDEAGLANVRKDIVEFKDLDRSHWAYYQIVEASNTHEFYRAKDGEVPEVWVRVLKTWNDFLK